MSAPYSIDADGTVCFETEGNKMKKMYLGDGLYAEFDGYQIELFTNEGGPRKTNRVFLEPGVLQNFLFWIEHLREPDKLASKEGDS